MFVAIRLMCPCLHGHSFDIGTKVLKIWCLKLPLIKNLLGWIPPTLFPITLLCESCEGPQTTLSDSPCLGFLGWSDRYICKYHLYIIALKAQKIVSFAGEFAHQRYGNYAHFTVFLMKQSISFISKFLRATSIYSS